MHWKHSAVSNHHDDTSSSFSSIDEIKLVLDSNLLLWLRKGLTCNTFVPHAPSFGSEVYAHKFLKLAASSAEAGLCTMLVLTKNTLHIQHTCSYQLFTRPPHGRVKAAPSALGRKPRSACCLASNDSGRVQNSRALKFLPQSLCISINLLGLTGPRSTADPATDLAVFQFTLGIPGFDDAMVPRIVGFGVILLLIANHVAGSSPAPAQVSKSQIDVHL